MYDTHCTLLLSHSIFVNGTTEVFIINQSFVTIDDRHKKIIFSSDPCAMRTRNLTPYSPFYDPNDLLLRCKFPSCYVVCTEKIYVPTPAHTHYAHKKNVYYT